MDKQLKAKVIYDRVVLFEQPGSTRYVTMVYKGDICTIVDSWLHADRPWKDKQFVKVISPDGKEGYMNVHALQEVRDR